MTLAIKAHFSQNINPHFTDFIELAVDGHGYARKRRHLRNP